MASSHISNLQERVFRGTTPPLCLTLPLSSMSSSPRSHLYKHWSQERMEGALKEVVNGRMSVRQASMQYDVPRSTLGDRVSGRVLPGAVSGPIKYLSTNEENELANFLERSAAMGYGKSVSDVLALVQRVLDTKQKGQTVSRGWWDSFSKRHPRLTLRIAASLSIARSKAADPEMLSHYFDLLEETVVANGLEGKPGQIFNMDETGVPLDPAAPKIVCRKGSSVCAIGSGNKSQFTVVGCVSASGFAIPPMVILDRKTLAPDFAAGEVPGTIYGLSAKGWIDYELFDQWFHLHFLHYAPSIRPLLLLMDGHSSHYCPATIKLAASEQVILFALPPNTTHISQPLDKGCFGPLKVAWKEVCHKYMTNHPGRVVTRLQFSQLFNAAWMNSMTISNIVSGFRVTGIYPIDREKLLEPLINPSQLTQDTGLAYIPLYSPTVRSKRTTSRIGSGDMKSSFEICGEEVAFTKEELAVFEKWFDNGDNVTDNSRYSLWLSNFHPMSSAAASHVWMQCKQSSGLSKLLSLPAPPCKRPTVKPKSCGRVLTSHENLVLLDEKQRAKEEAEKEKQERKLERERKREKEKGNSLIKLNFILSYPLAEIDLCIAVLWQCVILLIHMYTQMKVV